MIDFLRLLVVLAGLVHPGPVRRNLADATGPRCSAPPMAYVMEMVHRSAERHGVPLSVYLGVILVESGWNPCATFAGVGEGGVWWACHRGGGQCSDGTDRTDELQRQIEAGAVILARQRRFAPGGEWTYAVQGYHLGGRPHHLRACHMTAGSTGGPAHPAWAHHVYALHVMHHARRIAVAMGWPETTDAMALWRRQNRVARRDPRRAP